MKIAPRQPLPFSISVRVGGRKMTLTWRPRKRLPALLRGLLTRAWLALSGAALSGAALAGAPMTGNALPNGHALVAGQASVTQAGNRLDITQTSAKAILNWNSFNIGNQASVRFIQPNGDAVALNRVLGDDPSVLLGRLSANGKVWLINPAGIMVGQGARIDVAGLVASTLAVRDEDFLAGRLNFAAPAGATPGAVRNFGQIGTPAGGSVHLIGAGVDNHGLITTPGGEVLLAAGQRVRLIDTGTPGVAVEITGAEGGVTNLGRIVSAAGRIGLAAALVRNDGAIDASSVVAEGGRIFLRAGRALDTGAGSRIAADGAGGGGEVTLRADDSAHLDGAVSARGDQGGGFVETSGTRALWLAAAPRTGAGGHWLIDPENVTIQTRNADATSSGAVVTTGMIETALNAGTDVSVTTGTGGAQAGDITVADPITKTAGADATLSLSAGHAIHIAQPVRSSSGKLNLSLTANADGGAGGVVEVGAALGLNGGELRVAAPLVLRGATLDGLGALVMTKSDPVEFGAGGVNGGVNTVNADLTLARVTLSGGALRGRGKLSADKLTWTGGAIVGDPGDPAYDIGNLALSGPAMLDGRALNLTAGGGSTFDGADLTLSHSATLNNAGALTLSNTRLGVHAAGAGAGAINNSGTINAIAGNRLADGGNAIGGNFDADNGVAFNNSGTVNVTDSTLSLGGNGSHTGAFHIVASGAGATGKLRFGSDQGDANHGVQQLAAAATVSETAASGGVATLEFGDSDHYGGGVIKLDAALTLERVALSGGTLQGGGKLSATNFAWSGGGIKGGLGDPAYDIANLTLTGFATLDGRALNLAGGASSMNMAYLALRNSATLNNAGALRLNNTLLGIDGDGAGASVINNDGVINSGDDAGYSLIGGGFDAANGVAFNNRGTVNVDGGTLALGGNGTHSGAFHVVAASAGSASRLNFGAAYYPDAHAAIQTLTPAASIGESGDGGAMVEFGTPGLDQRSVITNLDAPVTLRRVTLSGGTLQGAGKLSATDLIWLGGVIKGKPNGGDAPYDITNLALIGSATLDGRTLNLGADGQSALWGANLTLLNSATVNNAGLLTLSNAQLGAGGAGAGAGVVNNSGAIVTDDGFATTSTTGASGGVAQSGAGGVEPPPSSAPASAIGGVYDADNRVTFRNSGVVMVTQGTLRLAGGTGNDGRIDVAAGATLSTAAADLINNSGGTLSGGGAIDVGGATLVNRGLIEPGADGAPGTLSLNGNFEQAAGGRLALRLAGAGAGQFDRLDVSGKVKLGGALTATLSGAYTPASGDALPFLTGRGARAGEFDSVDAPAGLRVGYSLFDGEAARLSFVDTAPGGAARYFDNGAGDFKWDSAANWSGDKLPGALDDVVIDAGFAVLHGAGADGVRDLAIKRGNALNLSGGSLLVSGAASLDGALDVGAGAALTVAGPLTGDGRLSVTGGGVTLRTGASIAALDLSGGRLDGAGRLDIGHQFTRAGGAIGASFDALSINQDGGALAPGPLAAAGPVSLTAPNGALRLDSISATRIAGRAGGGDIVLAPGAELAASDAGNAVVLDAGGAHFVNQGGPAAILAAGRYLIYTAGPDGDTLGGIGARPVFGHDFASYAPHDVRQSGNRVIHRDAGAPYLVRIDGASRVYGDDNPAFGYTLAPAMPGDTIGGVPLLGSGASRASAVGDYTISGGAGDLVSDYNLRFAFAPATLTVTPRPLNVTVSASKVYDGNTVFSAPRLSVSNLVNDDNIVATAAFANSEDKRAGANKPLSARGVALSGAGSGNYSVAGGVATGGGDIAPRPVTVLGLTAGDKVYDGGVVASLGGGALDGLVGGDAVVIDRLDGAFADRNAGANKAVGVTGVTLAGADAGNYRVAAPPSGLSASITPKPLATWVGGASGLWSEPANWDGGAVPDGANVLAVALPGEGGVVYDATLGHTTLDGLDSHKSLVIGGGHLTLGAGAALIHDGATLELRDGARLSVAGRLDAANYVQSGGALDGGGKLTVGNSFHQSAGRIALDGADGVAITQAAGDLSVASLSAPAVALAAPAGAITQTGPLVTLALTTRSASGVTLGDAGNRIARFGAVNSGGGAITLRNTSKPDSITLDDLSNQSGGIAIDNTGAIVSAGALNAGGDVTLVAHSPITVDAPILAGGDITLRAQASGGGDAIVINSALRSSGANIDLNAATDVTLGARASLTVPAGAAIRLTAGSGSVTLLPGASASPSPIIAEGAPRPTAAAPDIDLPAQVQLQAISKPLTLAPAASLPTLTPVSSLAEGNKLTLAGQTIGATADSFGGTAVVAGAGTGAGTGTGTGTGAETGTDEQSRATDDAAATPGPATGKATGKAARKTPPPACN